MHFINLSCSSLLSSMKSPPMWTSSMPPDPSSTTPSQLTMLLMRTDTSLGPSSPSNLPTTALRTSTWWMGSAMTQWECTSLIPQSVGTWLPLELLHSITILRLKAPTSSGLGLNWLMRSHSSSSTRIMEGAQESTPHWRWWSLLGS